MGVLLLSWLTVRLLVDLTYRDADTPIYQRYGEWIESGLAPTGTSRSSIRREPSQL